MWQKQTNNSVLHLSGRGWADVPIPRQFVPKIDIEIFETQLQAQQQNATTFADLLNLVQASPPSFLETEPFFLVNMYLLKFEKKL